MGPVSNPLNPSNAQFEKIAAMLRSSNEHHNEEPSVVAPNTHLILIWPEQQTEVVFRGEDGIMIAQRKNKTVVWGDDYRYKMSRVFLNFDSASSFLRKHVIPQDIDRKLGWFKRWIGYHEVPCIEERPGQRSGIVLPADVMDLPNTMGMGFK